MSADKVLEMVNEVVSERLEIQGFDLDADFKSLVSDEMAEVEIMMDLEDRTGLLLPYEDVTSIGTVRDLAEYVKVNMKK